MSKEFRCFIPFEKKSQKKSWFSENRVDIYITFLDLPKEVSRTFGLKFRDVFEKKEKIEGIHLELKVMKKSFGNGVELWDKILSTYLAKPIVIIDKTSEKSKNEENKELIFYLEKTPVIFNKQLVIEEILPFLKYPVFEKIGVDSKIELALISKQRSQKHCKSYRYEKTLINFCRISSFPSQSYNILSFCVENFSVNSIEDLKDFAKKWAKLQEKYKISSKEIKGYPEFILDFIQ